MEGKGWRLDVQEKRLIGKFELGRSLDGWNGRNGGICNLAGRVDGMEEMNRKDE